MSLRLTVIVIQLTCLGILPAAEGQPGSMGEPQLLTTATHDGAGSAADAVLMQLSRGESPEWSLLPNNLFTEPIGRSDPDTIGLHRWTLDLPAAIARLDDDSAALAALDERYHKASAALDTSQQAALAALHLPAPDALAVYRRWGDRCFDHGRFRTFLHIADRLKQMQPSSDHDPRIAVARKLLGLDGLALPGSWQPGPVQAAATMAAEPSGITVSWARSKGQLLALDPWNRVQRQFQVPRDDSIVMGDGAAVILGYRELTIVHEDGRVSRHSAPADARVLGIQHGAVWFQLDSQAWRLELGDQSVHRVNLPAAMLGAPVAISDERHAWLSPNEIIVTRLGQITARFAHDLQLDAQARLRCHDDRLIIHEPDRAWLIDDLADHLDESNRFSLLLRARQFDTVIDEVAALPAPTDEQLAAWYRALAARGDQPSMQSLARLPDCTDVAAKAIHLLAGLIGEQADACRAALRQLAERHPELEVPLDGDPLRHPTSWRHVITGNGLALWLGRDEPPSPEELDFGDVQRVSPALGQSWERHPTLDHGLRVGDLLFRVKRLDEAIEVTAALFETATPLWRHRITSRMLLPSQNLAFDGHHLIVTEGQARIHALDPFNGTALAHCVVPTGEALAERTGASRALGVYYLVPPRSGHTLVITKGRNATRIELPSRARWALAHGDAILTGHDDGARSWPGGERVVVPEAWLAADRLYATPEGIVADAKLYPWRR